MNHQGTKKIDSKILIKQIQHDGNAPHESIFEVQVSLEWLQPMCRITLQVLKPQCKCRTILLQQ